MTTRKSQQSSASGSEYESLEVIGNGTFGIIRKVQRRSDGQYFARKELKFERMSERDKKQIVAEVNILRTLRHENVVKYEERSIDSEKGILYIVMEYCGGGDLGSVIQKCRKTKSFLPEETVWSYLAQMTLALDACHYRGGLTAATVSASSGNSRDSMGFPLNPEEGKANAILHRDLKPENVFLDTEGNIKLGDFGLSKQVGALAFAQTYVGTPYYMSPELSTGKHYDAKSDIWALGCIVYELCALSPPFDAQDQAELTHKIMKGHVPALPRGYSSELGEVVNAMLQLDPRKRPTTRQLLTLKQVRFACRTLHLADMHRKMTVDKAKLKARQTELEERQIELARREAEMEAAQSQYQGSASHKELMEREENARKLEEEALRKQKSVDAQRQMCSDEWDKWYGSEKGRVLEENKAMAEKIGELEARIRELEGGSVLPPLSSRKSGLTRAESITNGLGARPAATGSRAVRPPTRRTTSGGRSRLSIDADVSMQSIREKLVAGATGLGTPKSIRQKELDLRVGNAAGLRPRTSSSAEEWVDQEGRSSPEEASAPSEPAPAPRVSSRLPRYSDHSASSSKSNAPDVARRERPLSRILHDRRARREQNGDDSDFAMRPASDDSESVIELSASVEEECSDAVTNLPSSDGLSAPLAKVELGMGRRRQSIAMAGARKEERLSSSQASARPAMRARNTISDPTDAVAEEQRIVDTIASKEDPQWLQYDEEDRPSPFIKRMTRLPEKTLSKLVDEGKSAEDKENLRSRIAQASRRRSMVPAPLATGELRKVREAPPAPMRRGRTSVLAGITIAPLKPRASAARP